MQAYSIIPMFMLLALPLWCLAVRPYVPDIADPVLEPWRWREIEDLDGQGVLCMDEADDGAFWFGCIGGVVRYDGKTVQRIPFDEELISRIDHDPRRTPWGKSVLCMGDGSLLVVVDSGLVQWVDGSWHVISQSIGPTLFETGLEKVEDDSIWLLTSTELTHFSPDLTKWCKVLKAGEEELLTAFCRDRAGDIWVVRNIRGEFSELVHVPIRNGRPVEESQWDSYRAGEDAQWPEAAVCEGPDGKIWYVDSGSQQGVRAFDPRDGTWSASGNSDSRKRFYSLIRGADDTLWATGAGILYAIRESGERYYPSFRHGLPSVPLTMFQTSVGRWFVLGRGGYVYILDLGEEKWLTYIGLHFECESASGIQWYLMNNRNAVSYDPATGEWLQYDSDDGLIDNARSLYASSHRVVWAIGSHGEDAALSVFNGKRWNRKIHPELASQIGDESIYEAEDGSVWLGASGNRELGASAAGGALQYEVTPNGAIRLLKHHIPPEVPFHISRFARAQDGSLWMGSTILYQYDAATLTHCVIPALPGVFTHDLVLDADRNLWVAKGLFGIYRKGADGWMNYTMTDGLPGKFVVDLLPLADGTLLAAFSKGISRFDGTSWAGNVLSDDFGMSNRSGTMRQSADGSVWYNFNVRDVRSPRVIMNFTSSQRYCTVRHRPETQPPETRIESHPEEVESSGNIHVSWSGRDPWGETPVGQLQYSWRMNDADWSSFSGEIGRTFLNLEHGRHRLAVRARDCDFNIDPTPAVSQFMVVPPVWRRIWFIAMVLSLAGVSTAFIGMLVYFHEKRLKERQRHLVEMDQLKTGFLTNISHELNTPLGLIKGALGHMLDNKEEMKTLHDVAMRSVDRVSTLVSQILDFRKLEQGRIRMEPVERDISNHIREHIEMLLPLAEKKQVSCEVDIIDFCVGWFDPDKLKKITSNLVSNAIKYTPSGGRVRIVLNEVTDSGAGRAISLVVEDSGAGVEPEHLQRIFDRFYRIPEKAIVDGSGIGLNLTKDLVDLWGGEIRVESPVHQDPEHPGSRFSVMLPIERERILNCGAGYE